jgi:branched-chain amino acid transport system ATP-binding protein
MNEVMRLEGVSAGYGGHLAIEEVNLSVPRLGITALLGANGMGKTTLMRTVVGLLRAKRGDIFFDGRKISRLSCRGRIRSGLAYVPERGQVVQKLTVAENLTLGGLTLSRTGFDAASERTLLLFPALRPLWRTDCWRLSGGEQQMVAVGRALMQSPKLLLLDEPSLGLAPLVVSSLFATLRSLQATQEMSILVVEQNFRLAAKVAEQLYFMKKGRIVLRTDAAEASNPTKRDEILSAYLGA